MSEQMSPSSSPPAGPSKSFRSDKPALEWTAEEVANWVATLYDDEVVVKFVKQKITGRRLRQLALWSVHPKYLTSLGLGTAEDIEGHFQFKEFARAIFNLKPFDEEACSQCGARNVVKELADIATTARPSSSATPRSSSASSRAREAQAMRTPDERAAGSSSALVATPPKEAAPAEAPASTSEQPTATPPKADERAPAGAKVDAESGSSAAKPASHKKGVARRAAAKPIVPPGMPSSSGPSSAGQQQGAQPPSDVEGEKADSKEVKRRKSGGKGDRLPAEVRNLLTPYYPVTEHQGTRSGRRLQLPVDEQHESGSEADAKKDVGKEKDGKKDGDAEKEKEEKEGAEKKKEDEPTTKNPRTAYRFFIDEQAPRYNHVKGASQRSTLFRKMWEELSKEQREPYEKMQAEEEQRFGRKARTDRGRVKSEEAANGDGDAGSSGEEDDEEDDDERGGPSSSPTPGSSSGATRKRPRPSGSPPVDSSKMQADLVNPDIPRDASWGRAPYATKRQFKDVMEAANKEANWDYQIVKKYTAFSKEVYGEVNPPLVQIIIKELGITKDDVFLDIGCGWGNVVFQVAAMVGCRSVGIEVREDLNKVSQQVNPIFERMMQEQGIQAGKCEFHCGDASEDTWIYTEYTKVFMNNFVFPEDISQKVLKLFEATLPDKAMLLTLRHLDKKYKPTSGYYAKSPLRIFSWPFRHFRTSDDVVSWTASSMEGFVYTVARGANGIKREPAEAASSSSSAPAKKRTSERDRKRQRTVAASPSMSDAPSSRDHDESEEESTCPSPMDMSAGAISVKVEPRSAAGGLLPPPPTIPTGPYNGKGVFPERGNGPAAAASKGRRGPRDGPAPAALTPPSPDDVDLLAVLLHGAAPPQHVRPVALRPNASAESLRCSPSAPIDRHSPAPDVRIRPPSPPTEGAGARPTTPPRPADAAAAARDLGELTPLSRRVRTPSPPPKPPLGVSPARTSSFRPPSPSSIQHSSPSAPLPSPTPQHPSPGPPYLSPGPMQRPARSPSHASESGEPEVEVLIESNSDGYMTPTSSGQTAADEVPDDGETAAAAAAVRSRSPMAATVADAQPRSQSPTAAAAADAQPRSQSPTAAAAADAQPRSQSPVAAAAADAQPRSQSPAAAAAADAQPRSQSPAAAAAADARPRSQSPAAAAAADAQPPTPAAGDSERSPQSEPAALAPPSVPPPSEASVPEPIQSQSEPLVPAVSPAQSPSEPPAATAAPAQPPLSAAASEQPATEPAAVAAVAPPPSEPAAASGPPPSSEPPAARTASPTRADDAPAAAPGRQSGESEQRPGVLPLATEPPQAPRDEGPGGLSDSHAPSTSISPPSTAPDASSCRRIAKVVNARPSSVPKPPSPALAQPPSPSLSPDPEAAAGGNSLSLLEACYTDAEPAPPPAPAVAPAAVAGPAPAPALTSAPGAAATHPSVPSAHRPHAVNGALCHSPVPNGAPKRGASPQPSSTAPVKKRATEALSPNRGMFSNAPPPPAAPPQATPQPAAGGVKFTIMNKAAAKPNGGAAPAKPSPAIQQPFNGVRKRY